MDSFLNDLQSVQLPFALIPLIKFVSNEKVMKEFAIGRFQFWIATAFGTALFLMNFYIIFADAQFSNWQTWAGVIIGCVIYVGLILIVIIEPVYPLREMTKEEMDDHEYK